MCWPVGSTSRLLQIELAARDGRLGRHAVEARRSPRRSGTPPESGRRRARRNSGTSMHVRVRDRRTAPAGRAMTLSERRRLRDRERAIEVRIERDVVVEDLARARAPGCRRASNARGSVVPALRGAHASVRRELGRLHFAAAERVAGIASSSAGRARRAPRTAAVDAPDGGGMICEYAADVAGPAAASRRCR